MIALSIEGIVKYPIVFLTGLLVSYALTPAVKRVARAAGMMDMPGGRRIHAQPTPRCGIAVFMGFHAACAAIFLVPWTHFVADLSLAWWTRFLPLSALLLLIGLADDRWGLSPWSKLAGQSAVAMLAFASGMRVDRVLGLDLPVGIDAAATLLWFLAIINAFNLIDGMDGLATGLASIAALGLGGSFLLRHLPGDALILFGLVGACLGFLRYNFHPATIFLGDSGSMFLGFTLAAVALGTGAKGTAIATIAVPLLAVGVPIFDTALAVWRRAVRHVLYRTTPDIDAAQGRVFAADMDHLHHKLLRSGLSQRAVATSLYALSASLMAVGLLSMTYRSHAMGIYIVAFLLTTYVAVKHLARVELWDSGRAIVSGLSRPPHRFLSVLVYPPLDVLLLSGALAVATFYSDHSLAALGLRRFWFDRIPIWVGVPFLSLFLVRTYQRVWSRARASEFALLALALAAGILMAAGLAAVIVEFSLRDLALIVLVYGGLALPLVTGIRLLPRVVLDGMAWSRRAASDDRQPNHTLVYGTDHRCQVWLDGDGPTPIAEDKDPARVVGLLDDDPNLHGRLVHGYPVIGGIEDLPKLIPVHHVESIILTQPLRDAARDRLLQIAQEHGVKVTERRTVETLLTGPVRERIRT